MILSRDSTVVIAIKRGACLARLAALAASVACAGCAAITQPAAAGLDAELQQLLELPLAHDPPAPGVILRVEAGGLGYVWTGAAGTADLRTGSALRPDHVVRIASNTKSYVAAAVLRLVETQRIELDGTIGRHLSAATVARLRAAGYDTAKISARTLLQHTSGLRDFISTEYLAQIAARPRHRWTRDEQVALALAKGGPLAPPGEKFHYSDTGYLLLGETVEAVTGRTLAAAIRDLLDMRKLKLAHTWFESLEQAPPGVERAHQYLGRHDANDIDPSADLYGGGGLLSTAAELARFYRALVRGMVLQPATTALMLAPSPQSLTDGGAGYGMGVAALQVGDLTCHGHSGFWGTVAWHCPQTDVTVVAVVTSTDARRVLTRLTQEAIRRTAAMQASASMSGQR
jgi:D-alanyl-D-alanine carboxypeptidase